MSPLDFTKSRLRAFLDEIYRLSEAEFPYGHSQNALKVLQNYFEEKLELLDSFSPSSDRSIVDHMCTLISNSLFTYLPILGFILRSTNVRNAFEVFGPILRLAGDVLEPTIPPHERTTKLILSSEWDYSPYVYRDIPDLPGFALIGLPAPESSNPFLIPLSGHELGHLVWVRHTLRSIVEPILTEGVISIIELRWPEYKKLFPHPNIQPSELRTNILAMQHWLLAKEWALRQAEETFSDFVGLRIFGASFLFAFAYLLSPKLAISRSVIYPSLRTRAKYLEKASELYEISPPADYSSLFGESEVLNLTEADEFRLSLADEALVKALDVLIRKANEIVDLSKVPRPSVVERDRIYGRLEQVVPAEESRTLPDILNAAWQAYREGNLWSDVPQIFNKKESILKEVVLKNIEVFEIEQIQKTA